MLSQGHGQARSVPDRIDPHEIRRAADLRIALRRFTHADDQAARSAGLTPKRYQLLLLVGSSESTPSERRLTVSGAAEKLGISLSAAAELASRAEQAGLLERTPAADDARVTTLFLTDEGTRRMLAAYDGAVSHEGAMVDALRRAAGDRSA